MNIDPRRVNLTKAGGLLVSTMHTIDEGYETALIDQRGAHPVQRYQGLNEAIVGHQGWVRFAKDRSNNTITKLGGFFGLVPAEPYALQRKEKGYDEI